MNISEPAEWNLDKKSEEFMKKTKIKFDGTIDRISNERLIQLGGFWIALQRFGIWGNGSRTIGCLNVPIREALENEVMIYFVPEDCDKVVRYVMDKFPDIEFY
jgi:hypothetical protein